MIRFMLCIFGRSITEVMLCSSHPILSCGIRFWFVPLLMIFSLITWLKWYLPGFLPVKLSFALCNKWIFWGEDILEPCKYLVPHQTFSLCVYLYLYGFLGYSKGYNSLFSFIFTLKLAPFWPVEAPRSWLLCTFAMSPTFFEHSLVYWHNKMFQVHHVFSLPQLWNQPFAQGSVIPFGRKWCLEVKIWARDVITVIPRLSVDWAREYIYLSIYYLSIYLNLSWKLSSY